MDTRSYRWANLVRLVTLAMCCAALAGIRTRPSTQPPPPVPIVQDPNLTVHLGEIETKMAEGGQDRYIKVDTDVVMENITQATKLKESEAARKQITGAITRELSTHTAEEFNSTASTEILMLKIIKAVAAKESGGWLLLEIHFTTLIIR